MCKKRCLITKEIIMDGLDNNYFVNHYQPIYDMTNNNLNGVEVLLRLKHPDNIDICPDCFISCAEKENLINDLFFFSADRAIKDININSNLKKLSINVSPTTLSLPGLSLWLNKQCLKYNVKKNNITLEITESVEYFETKESIENIKQLKYSGFGLSIDDFGTGFSSLSRLKSIPFTELKIDKIFIQNIATNYSDRKMVEYLVFLSKGLGLQIVAEGIENFETYRIVKKLGVNLCQGYFYHRPMAIEDILEVSF